MCRLLKKRTHSLVKPKIVDTQSYKTKSMRPQDIERKWYVVDALNHPVGRLSSRIAEIIRGKHRPYYTPHVDCGDHVIVINAEKVRLTGNKWEDKEYIRYTGYPGGQRSLKAKELLEQQPERVIERAVRGMMPKNRLSRKMLDKLHVYAGEEHPHQAQQPEPLNL